MILTDRTQIQAAINGDYRVDKIREFEARIRMHDLPSLQDWSRRVRQWEERRKRNRRIARTVACLLAALAGIAAARGWL